MIISNIGKVFSYDELTRRHGNIAIGLDLIRTDAIRVQLSDTLLETNMDSLAMSTYMENVNNMVDHLLMFEHQKQNNNDGDKDAIQDLKVMKKSFKRIKEAQICFDLAIEKMEIASNTATKINEQITGKIDSENNRFYSRMTAVAAINFGFAEILSLIDDESFENKLSQNVVRTGIAISAALSSLFILLPSAISLYKVTSTEDNSLRNQAIGSFHRVNRIFGLDNQSSKFIEIIPENRRYYSGAIAGVSLAIVFPVLWSVYTAAIWSRI